MPEAKIREYIDSQYVRMHQSETKEWSGLIRDTKQAIEELKAAMLVHVQNDKEVQGEILNTLNELNAKVKPLDEDHEFKKKLGNLSVKVGAFVVGLAAIIEVVWHIIFPPKI